MVALPYSLISWFFSSLKCHSHNLGNIPLDEDVLKTSWRRLSSLSSEDVLIKTNMFALALRLQKTSSRRLGQDQYIRLGHTSSRRLQDVFKMSSRRLKDVLPRRLQDVLKASSRRLAKTSSRHLAKTSSRRLAKTSSKRLQDVCKNVFKTSSRRFEDVFKTSSRHLPEVLQGCLQDVLKTYHQVKLLA